MWCGMLKCRKLGFIALNDVMQTTNEKESIKREERKFLKVETRYLRLSQRQGNDNVVDSMDFASKLS